MKRQKVAVAAVAANDDDDDDDVTDLHTVAAMANDPTAPACVLKARPNLTVDTLDGEGYPALTYAAKSGHHLFVQGLLEVGATVDGRPQGPRGLTALAEACFWMNDFTNNPHNHPAFNVKDEEYFGKLPKPDYAETVRLLLEAGADPNLRASLGGKLDEQLCPLDLLFFESSTRKTGKVATRIAELLKKHGADVTSRGPTQDLTAAETARAMGFKAAAAILDPIGKGRD
jgi:ankyrin repeat protein